MLFDENERFKAGLAMRKAVLGDDYVNQSLEKADAFSAPLQQMVTEHAWFDIWNRPGLERKTRSMINLAMLIALNRPHELKLHLRGALTNGVTEQEIQEVLLQAMVYCGAPAGVDAFRIAREVLAEVKQA